MSIHVLLHDQVRICELIVLVASVKAVYPESLMGAQLCKHVRKRIKKCPYLTSYLNGLHKFTKRWLVKCCFLVMFFLYSYNFRARIVFKTWGFYWPWRPWWPWWMWWMWWCIQMTWRIGHVTNTSIFCGFYDWSTMPVRGRCFNILDLIGRSHGTVSSCLVYLKIIKWSCSIIWWNLRIKYCRFLCSALL